MKLKRNSGSNPPTCSPSFAREYHAALRRMLARGQTRLSANCLAAELWPDARHNNAHGQSFNLAAGVAGRVLRKYRGCHEVQNRVWEIVPEFISENASTVPTAGLTTTD